MILEGLIPHRDHIKVICTNQNEIGAETLMILDDVIPNLDEIIIKNPTNCSTVQRDKAQNKENYQPPLLPLLQNCSDYGKRLQRIQV